MAVITWGDIAFPTDCDGTLNFPAVPDYSDDCVPVPGKVQISEFYFWPDGADDGFTYNAGPPVTVSLTVDGFDNSDTTSAKSKFLPCTGSMDAPEENIYEGAKEVDVITDRRYRLNLQIAYSTLEEYQFLRYFQGNYRKFKFRFGDLDGWLFGGEDAIRPVFVTAQFPKENSRGGRKVCTLLLDFITTDGDPPAHLNPMA